MEGEGNKVQEGYKRDTKRGVLETVIEHFVRCHLHRESLNLVRFNTYKINELHGWSGIAWCVVTVRSMSLLPLYCTVPYCTVLCGWREGSLCFTNQALATCEQNILNEEKEREREGE